MEAQADADSAKKTRSLRATQVQGDDTIIAIKSAQYCPTIGAC